MPLNGFLFRVQASHVFFKFRRTVVHFLSRYRYRSRLCSLIYMKSWWSACIRRVPEVDSTPLFTVLGSRQLDLVVANLFRSRLRSLIYTTWWWSACLATSSKSTYSPYLPDSAVVSCSRSRLRSLVYMVWWWSACLATFLKSTSHSYSYKLAVVSWSRCRLRPLIYMT